MRWSSKTSTRALSHAAMHDLIMLHVSHRCDRLSLAGAEKWQLRMTFRRRAWAAEQQAAWFGSRSNWLQLVSRCGDLCVARTPRPMSTSQQRIRCAGVEVDVCVAPEPHGLVESGSSASGTVVACPVVDPVAIGCGRARSTVTLWSNKKVSFFRPAGGAITHLYKL